MADPLTATELLGSGRTAFQAGRYAATVAAAEAASELYAAARDPRGRAEASNLIGCVELERGDYKRAAELFVQAHERFAECADESGMARTRSNLGLVHWRIHDLPRAREDFLAVLPVFEAANDARGIGNTLNSLGLVCDEEGDRGAAIALYRRALPFVESAGDQVFTANVLANLADAQEALGDLDSAWAEAERAFALRASADHRRGVVGSRVSLARLALARGDSRRARAEIREGLALAALMGLRKQEADLVDLSARERAAEGAWEAAYGLLARASALKRTLGDEELTHHVANLRARLDVQEATRVAEARRLENDALRTAKQAAEAASRAKSEFVAVVSHEIRSPLTTVVGAMELLRDTSLDTRQRQLLDLASASTRALLGVVEDVLDLSRIEAGRLTTSHDEIDMDELLEQLRGVLGQRAEPKGLAFTLERAPNVPAFGLGDFARLRQVLVNLLVNGVKFTHRGSIGLRVEADPGGLVFTVTDTGIGISPEVLPHVFDPFVQADSSTTRRYGGAGLGLFIARQIVQAMGGTLAATSTLGRGSEFRVAVPFPPVPARSRPLPEPTAPVRSGARVLVVDDDPGVAFVVVALLEHIGCTVRHVSTAAAALEAARQAQWTLVMLDVHMPEVDGYTLAGMLRAEHGPGLRLVGLSGAASAEDRAKALESGMDLYLTKPVTLAALRALLQSV